jgi:GNAT superfamily N-acetyltransferase
MALSPGIILDERALEDDERTIRKGVSAFGDQHTVPRNWRAVTLVLRSDEGRVVGGLLGSTVWDWLQIDTLWVDDAVRGRGHGRALITRAEQIALGCGRYFSARAQRHRRRALARVVTRAGRGGGGCRCKHSWRGCAVIQFSSTAAQRLPRDK